MKRILLIVLGLAGLVYAGLCIAECGRAVAYQHQARTVAAIQLAQGE